MLLPVTTFSGSERKLHSFVAALQLGSQLKFGGNIDHLQTTVINEPVPDSTYRKKYLVLYDTVPGGTGYLKQLMRSEKPLMEVFEQTISFLRSCTCNQDPDKDGCYRCLYAYRTSYNMAGTSRETAVELLDEILKYKEKLAPTDNLKNIRVNVLFDSELEARFIEALQRVRTDELPVTLNKTLVNGKPGYFFKISDQAWYIEPQVKLGPVEGINIPSKADFVFHPARSQEEILPIAIFTDGFFYHKERVGQDIGQRTSIIRSGKFHIWSLSWRDVENQYKAQGEYFENLLQPSASGQGTNQYEKFLKHYGAESLRKIHKTDSFDWLIRFLKEPKADIWRAGAFVHGLMHLDFKRFSTPESIKEWSQKVKDSFPDKIIEIMNEVEGSCLYGLFEVDDDTAQSLIKLFEIVKQEAVNGGDKESMRVACCLYNHSKNQEKKSFESFWNGYLRLYNLFQFLPYSLFVTTDDFDSQAYEKYRSEEAEASTGPEAGVDEEAWGEVKELVDPSLHDLLDQLAANGWPMPEAGFELTDPDGKVVAEAELGWSDLKFAFLEELQMDYSGVFESLQWRIFRSTQKNKIKVALASDFLTSFSNIPRSYQAKVLNFVNKFKYDPMLPGLNYEKIKGAKDPNMRSVRIDQSYRGIVLKPETGNVYMLLWVDKHDEAYNWAKNRVYKIHPETGSIQVIEIEETAVEPDQQTEVTPSLEKGLFDHIHDRNLLKLGVPEIQIPLVRDLKTEDELDQAADQLPQEAYEALFFIAAGDSLEDVIREMERVDSLKAVDIEDYDAALDTADSRRRFFVVEDDLELAAILNAPLEKWRVFLHPTQRKLVERDWNGPVRVLGGAGTGKTVVAIHRARWLAQNALTNENDRILFTTFTRNLAADIKDNLTKICKPEVMRRIEVVNLDKWVSDFLRKSGYSYKIDYGRLTDPLPQAVTSFEEYAKASRVGRGTRLNRKARKAIWTVFEEYRLLLNEHGLREGDDVLRDARLLLEGKKEVLPYRAIVVDEAQDMSIQAFKLIRQMIPGGERKNDLFIVGDAHQRIYRHKVVLGRCGIKIVGRSRKLRINYRTTEETRSWAVNLLMGLEIDDLDGGLDNQRGYKSLLHGIAPVVKLFDSFQAEIEYITEYLQQLENEKDSLKEVCLVARTNSLLKQYESALTEKGIDIYFIRRSVAEDRKASGLRMATMHRVKGLEFDRVIIAGVNDGVVPFEGVETGTSDPVIKKESEVHERALLYVSATRAKKEVLVTCFSEPSRFLGDFL
jgi:superfamily I DNA/RNA helicase